MAQFSRRRLLQFSAGLGALLPLSALASRLGGPDPVLALMSEADPLLLWVRQINTTQSVFRHLHGRYAELNELTPEAIATMRSVHAVPRPQGSEIQLRVSPDGSKYSLAIREAQTGLAYRSDETGVIRHGTATTALTTAANFGFDAEPIKRTINGKARSRVATPLSAIASFFVPTLYAGPVCTCGDCVGPGPCSCGGTGCCNIGTLECTWCCPNNCCPF